jgi:hypothetical protein
MQALQDVASSNVDDGGLVGQRLVQLRGVAEGKEEIVRRRRRRRGGGGGKDRDGQYSLGKPAPICVQRSPSGFDSHTISLLLVVVFLSSSFLRRTGAGKWEIHPAADHGPRVGGSNQSDVSDDGDSHFRRADEGSTNRTYRHTTAGSVKLFVIKRKVFFFNYTAHELMAFSFSRRGAAAGGLSSRFRQCQLEAQQPCHVY